MTTLSGTYPIACGDITVVIRADRETPFRLLYRIVVSCQEHGFRNFSLRALNRKEEP